MGLLAIPTLLLIGIAICIILCVVVFLAFMGLISIHPGMHKSKALRDEDKLESIGDQVKARQDRINDRYKED